MAAPTQDAAIDRLIAEAGRLGRGDASAGAGPRSREALFHALADSTGNVPPAARDKVQAAYEDAHGAITRREDLVDAGSEMSFPASDPPSYMAGTGTAGGPPPPEAEPEKPSRRVSDPAEVKPAKEDLTNPGSATPATKLPGS